MSSRFAILVFIIAFLLIKLLSVILTNEQLYVVYSILLLAYVGWETWEYYRKNPHYWLISFPVFASVFYFGISNVITAGYTLFFNESSMEEANSVLGAHDAFKWLAFHMELNIYGAFCMWRGFYAKPFITLGKFIKRTFTVASLLNETSSFNRYYTIIFFFIGITAKIVMIHFGLFGFSGEVVAKQLLASFNAYGDYLGYFSLLSIFLCSILVMKEDSSKYTFIFICICIVEVFLGIISGFKVNIILVGLTVFLAYYLVKDKLSLKYSIFALALFLFAYAAIEPVRYAHMYKRDASYDYSRLDQVILFTVEAVLSGETSTHEDMKTYDKGLARISEGIMTARALQYAHQYGGHLGEEAPEFLKDLLLAPFYSVIPRILWPEKPLSIHGNWFYRHVLGREGDTYVGMGVNGYLFFAGGTLMVITGFFVAGGIQRVAYELFFKDRFWGGLMICLLLLQPLAYFNNNFTVVITGFIRNSVVGLIFQNIVFTRKKNVKNTTYSP